VLDRLEEGIGRGEAFALGIEARAREMVEGWRVDI
jgi:hypothetical protein